MVRRTKLDIIYDMLLAIQIARGEIKPTKLLYKSNLSYNKLKEYLAELEEQSLININYLDDKKIISITDKGHEYVAELRKIRKLTQTMGLK